MIPHAWPAVVIVLGVYRIVRLIGWDDFPPIVRVRDWLTGESVRYNSTEQQGPIYRWKRPLLFKFLICAYCQGFWVSLAAYGCWLARPTWTLYGLAPFALSGAVGLLAKNLDA